MGEQNDLTDEVLALLCARWPKTFFHYEIRRRPLKIGIHRELAAILGDAVEQKLLYGALRRYVSNDRYLSRQRVGAVRIDLEGEPAGVVTEEQAENARKTRAGINAKQKQRRAELKRPEPKPEPRRDGLASLREAAAARRQRIATGGGT